MNSRFQPREETFDDVEGHGNETPVAPDTEDLEGHGEDSAAAVDDEDAEGHGRFNV